MTQKTVQGRLEDTLWQHWWDTYPDFTYEGASSAISKFFKEDCGDWIFQRKDITLSGNLLNVYKCSKCKCEHYTDHNKMYFKYCPTCGSKMGV